MFKLTISKIRVNSTPGAGPRAGPGQGPGPGPQPRVLLICIFEIVGLQQVNDSETTSLINPKGNI